MIIAIIGYRRCGKDYLTQKLLELYNNSETSAKRFAFADPLKEYICDLMNISREELEKLKEDINYTFTIGKKQYTMREFLVTFANRLRQIFGDDIWAKATIESMKKDNSNIKIISDMRFLIEYKTLKKFTEESGEELFIIYLDSDLESCDKFNKDEKDIEKISYNFKFFNTKDEKNFNSSLNKLIENINKILCEQPKLF